MSLASLFKINTIGILLSLDLDHNLLKLNNILSFPFHLSEVVFGFCENVLENVYFDSKF